MVTSFTRIVVVLSFLRTAMGAQQTPPNQVMVGPILQFGFGRRADLNRAADTDIPSADGALALFLTFFVMMPVLEASWEQGIRPLIEGKIDEGEAFKKASAPVHAFMMKHVREQDLRLFMDAANTPQVDGPEAVPLRALVPAFMISELRRAFEIGFLVFIPFLVIDMVVASVLMSMGMMMLPPIIIALPFKIIFFVLVDGWFLIVGSLIESFNGG